MHLICAIVTCFAWMKCLGDTAHYLGAYCAQWTQLKLGLLDLEPLPLVYFKLKYCDCGSTKITSPVSLYEVRFRITSVGMIFLNGLLLHQP